MVEAAGVVEFQSWLTRSGLTSTKVQLAPQTGPDMRGMIATVDIAADDSVLDVPFTMMMTLNTAQNGPLQPVVNTKQLTPTNIMALHLLNEKFNASSNFLPWIQMLPDTFETPMFWSDEELQDLMGSTVYSVTKKRKQTLTADYNNIFGVLFDEFPALFDKASYTLDAYKWAVSTVWARSFVFNIDGSQVPVIVPFADMFEHGNVASKFSLDEETKAFRITVGAAVKKGERVHVSLGEKPNSQLLTSYGFVLDQNEYDTVMISMFLNNDDPFYDVKAKILTGRGQPPDRLYYLNLQALPADFMRALRLQLLKPSQLDDYGKVFDDKPIGLENELDVYRQLVSACDQLLRSYPTTALEDQAALADAEAFKLLPERRQTALVMRFGEKRVLHRTIELVSKAWSQFLIDGFGDASNNFRFA